MAVPIILPSVDDDDICSLEVLIEELLLAARRHMNAVKRRRQITQYISEQRNLNHRNLSNERQNARPCSPSAPEDDVFGHPRLPLPDVVPESTDCDVPRLRKLSSSAPQVDPPSIWMMAGAQLRNIADSFKEERRHNQTNDKSSRLKEASFLSLLCGPIWTTVALLLGWRIFSQSR